MLKAAPCRSRRNEFYGIYVTPPCLLEDSSIVAMFRRSIITQHEQPINIFVTLMRRHVRYLLTSVRRKTTSRLPPPWHQVHSAY